tara:strand:- start:1413 stop:1865 length:453 start_codon:yes stop_codon:yes gene_type:complete
MPFPFNKELWNYGRKIEDEVLPIANKIFDCNFKRNENDIYDILDFKDDEKKVIVEVKGRRIPSTQYTDTIITASKITEGYHQIEQGYKVFFFFVFTDKLFQYELLEDTAFDCRYTGTNCIKHYMIPVANLTEIIQDPIEEEQEEEYEKIN